MPTFEFHSVGIRIGESLEAGGETFAWCPVKIRFARLDPPPVYPSVEFNVAIRYEPDWTIEQTRRAAFQEAKALLEAASDLLTHHDLPELERRRLPAGQ